MSSVYLLNLIHFANSLIQGTIMKDNLFCFDYSELNLEVKIRKYCYIFYFFNKYVRYYVIAPPKLQI